MAWKLISSVPNPCGGVTMTADGQSVDPHVQAYMARVAEVAAKRDCVSRRHHYVPQSYLRAWSPDGKRVRVLDTRNGLDKLRGLRDTCVEENFYRVTDPQHGPHNQVEAMLGVIDDETAVLLQKTAPLGPGDDLQLEWQEIPASLREHNLEAEARLDERARRARVAPVASPRPRGSIKPGAVQTVQSLVPPDGGTRGATDRRRH
ncbi:DUF4238 domain-containing protein [Sphaerisporangium sp. NPDC005288]|uniref:DUF4238 domain-containing protein n=1 Tax=Sphaerisporangium sp. NPDC005288 TaxID=3155114 RepID=UPI0033BAC147